MNICWYLPSKRLKAYHQPFEQVSDLGDFFLLYVGRSTPAFGLGGASASALSNIEGIFVIMVMMEKHDSKSRLLILWCHSWTRRRFLIIVQRVLLSCLNSLGFFGFHISLYFCQLSHQSGFLWMDLSGLWLSRMLLSPLVVQGR